MIGYPDGIWDFINNLPITRHGITATSPKFDFPKRNEFMIDMTIVEGSSGSPVFFYNEAGYRKGKKMVIGGRILFGGILYAGKTKKYKRDILYNLTGDTIKEISSYEEVLIDLGVVIKSHVLLDFVQEKSK